MIRIQLTIPEPGNHLVSVEMRLQPRLARLCLQLPGWTPGSYLIRDYVRNLEGLQVHQGEQPVACERLGPACWRLAVDPAGPGEPTWVIPRADPRSTAPAQGRQVGQPARHHRSATATSRP